MTNPLRNEVAITLAGKERTMRADFGAIVAIERDTRRSMLQHQLRGDISVTDMATIILRGLEAAGDKSLSLDQIGNAILDAGMSSEAIYKPVIEFIDKSTAGFSVGKPEEAPAKG